MSSIDNKVVIACAGSGKTTRIVRESLQKRDRRTLFLTYTNNNTNQIVRCFGELNSGIPSHVDVATWFGFLLRECARPYQNAKYSHQRIESVFFVNQKSTQYEAESNIKKYYFTNDGSIYSDKLAQFVIECENLSSGRVSARLREVYSDIFIDEFQDLAGWDINVIEMLLHSGIRITLVGDPRQYTYSTTPSNKNGSCRGAGFYGLAKEWEKLGLCVVEEMSQSHRCNQAICDFANSLWPNMKAMETLRSESNVHSGVFLVGADVVNKYVQEFKPQVLRYSKKAESCGCDAMNFGISKGLQFERVLIVPTKPIEKFLQTGRLSHVEKTKEKLYVAVTRAKYSVAFLYDGESSIVQSRYGPSENTIKLNSVSSDGLA